MSDPNPLEYVKYYPGQRLLAADLNQQETYDVTVRRLLNRGLFTPGVATGLDVARVQDSPKDLFVSAGLALDPQGREMYLAADVRLSVPNQPPTTAPGYYLVIRYAETPGLGTLSDCSSPSPTPPTGRYRIQPILEFTETYPDPRRCGVPTSDSTAEANCGIVLALVTLDNSCNISALEPGVRQYAFPTHISQVTAIALEGEKDIDSANPKVLQFHVQGGAARAVLLYIRGGLFSTLYYSELGRHRHSVDIQNATTSNETAPIQIAHTHHVPGQVSDVTNQTTSHRHDVLVGLPQLNSIATILDFNHLEDTNAVGAAWLGATSVDHQHGVAAHDTQQSTRQTTPPHAHSVTVTVDSRPSGVKTPGYGARDGADAHAYLNAVKVSLDDQDITGTLLNALPGWGTLGDGTAGHPINAADGSGRLDLVQLTGRTLDSGPHRLIFSVGAGGGKLLYNLYVE